MKKLFTILGLVSSMMMLNAQSTMEQQLLDSAAMFPNNSSVHNRLAQLYFNNKEYKKSLEFMDKAIVLNPSDTSYYYNMASIYNGMNDRGGELATYKRFSIALPCADAFNNMAFIYFSQFKYDEAVGYFRQAFSYNQKDYQCANNIGISYNKLGMFDSACVYSKKAVDISPEYLKGWTNLYKSSMSVCDLEGYVFAFDKARILNGGFMEYYDEKYYKMAKEVVKSPTASAYETYGDYLLEIGDKDGAVGAYKKSIKLNPKNGKLFFNLGDIYLSYSPPFNATAMNYFKNALPLLTGSMDKRNCMENIGLCYENIKDYTNAVIWYNKAVLQEPNFAKSTHYKLSRIYSVTGNAKQADYHRRMSF